MGAYAHTRELKRAAERSGANLWQRVLGIIGADTPAALLIAGMGALAILIASKL